MDDFKKLISNIKAQKFSNFYLLSGPEQYFIDKFESFITNKLIDDSNRGRIYDSRTTATTWR